MGVVVNDLIDNKGMFGNWRSMYRGFMKEDGRWDIVHASQPLEFYCMRPRRMGEEYDNMDNMEYDDKDQKDHDKKEMHDKDHDKDEHKDEDHKNKGDHKEEDHKDHDDKEDAEARPVKEVPTC